MMRLKIGVCASYGGLLFAAVGLMAVLSPQPLDAGQTASPVDAPSDPPAEAVPRRIFGIIPNYRSSPSLKDYAPLTVRQKFKLATQDSFDPGTLVLGALLGRRSDRSRYGC
jgi:hypothetical protein